MDRSLKIAMNFDIALGDGTGSDRQGTEGSERIKRNSREDVNHSHESGTREIAAATSGLSADAIKKRKYDDQKRQRRIIANRKSAAASRQRRLDLIDELERTVSSLYKTIADMAKENAELRRKLAEDGEALPPLTVHTEEVQTAFALSQGKDAAKTSDSTSPTMTSGHYGANARSSVGWQLDDGATGQQGLHAATPSTQIPNSKQEAVVQNPTTSYSTIPSNASQFVRSISAAMPETAFHTCSPGQNIQNSVTTGLSNLQALNTGQPTAIDAMLPVGPAGMNAMDQGPRGTMTAATNGPIVSHDALIMEVSRQQAQLNLLTQTVQTMAETQLQQPGRVAEIQQQSAHGTDEISRAHSGFH